MIFKQLYKLDKKRRTRVWNITTDDSTHSYTISHGLLGGKQVFKTTTCSPKNVGKANETTSIEQAEKEAAAQWLKQRDRECYLEDLKDQPHHIEPQLALDYSKVPHRLDWDQTVYAQAKLDGVRAIYTPENKDTLQSRKGIQYPLKKLADKLLFVQSQLGIQYPIDGEVYLHGVPLNRIHGAALGDSDLTDSLDFYIFDIVARGIPYEMRKVLLESVDTRLLPPNIKILTAFEIKEGEVQQEHDRMVNVGFEGIMLKGASGLYEVGFRSDDTFKYKNFEEEEFSIIDITPDKDGQGVIQYINNANSDTFGSRMKGSDSERKELLLNKENYIGKLGTVRFFKYTEYGIPQFPVTIAINQDK